MQALDMLSPEMKDKLLSELNQVAAAGLERVLASREERYLNAGEAAQYLKISPAIFIRLRKEGYFKPILYPGMVYPRYDRKDLDEFVEQSKVSS